jgi:hypothetical protein
LSGRQSQRWWTVGGGTIILLVIAGSLWDEFRVPGNRAWNIFLALFLVGLGVAAILIQRHFRLHPLDVGEARFDTTNKPEER